MSKRSRRRLASTGPDQLCRLPWRFAPSICTLGGGRRTEDGQWPRNSGDAELARAACRGVFEAYKSTSFKDILDGLANTIAAGEIATDLGDRDVRTQPVVNAGIQPDTADAGMNLLTCDGSIDPQRPSFWISTVDTLGTNAAGGDTWRARNARGYMWAYASPVTSGMNTTRPPNSPTCIDARNLLTEGTVSSSSRHQGGAHILMGDGAVKFITDSIDAGNQNSLSVHRDNTPPNPTAGAQSPYGLWGSLGTKASREVIDTQF